MTWQAGSLLLLGLVLVAGFGWYERRRPPAKVLALVAALAALAVIGRIAFAAIPNVKPSTDIVLFAGYALGAVPGFVVGAVFALVSNFFFGQGPWTVWQMAGWGGVAVAGAGLAKAMRQREDPGRLKLAIVCGAAGLAFGAWMDVYQWTLAARQDLGTYVAVSGTSLPYNLAHAIGNVVFCLLIGPAFVRALTRYRRRFEVRWPAPLKPAALATIVLAALLALPAAGLAASPASRATRYLVGSQNGDGGFGPARGQPSNQLHTGWAALGLASAGRNPRDVRRAGGRAIASYLRRGLGAVRDIGEIERTILVLKAAGLSPEKFGGRNLLAELLRKRRGDGSFAGFTSYTSFGILALRAAGEPVGKQTAGWLARAQSEDGGFGVSPEAGSDADMTGVGLQALAAIGRARGAAARDAAEWLRNAQKGDGGFSLTKGGDSNTQSTAYAVTGLMAVGAAADVVGRGLSYIRAHQRSDGSVAYSATGNQTPIWVTAQALLALRRAPFPLATAPRERPKPKPKAGRSRPDRSARKYRKSNEGERDSESRRTAEPIVRLPDPGTTPGEVSSLKRTSSEGPSDDGPSDVVLGLAVCGALATTWLARRRLLARRR